MVGPRPIPSYWMMPGFNSIPFAVSEYYGIEIDDLKIKSRERIVVEPRQISMAFMYVDGKMSLNQIGNFFYKDHASVIHAYKTISNLYETDKRIKNICDEINKKTINLPNFPEKRRNNNSNSHQFKNNSISKNC